MREEVIVLPPSADGRKASFVLDKTEEAAFNISRKWVAPESKGVEKVPRVKAEEEREEKGHMPAAEKVQTEALNGHERCTAPLQEVERGESPSTLSRDGMTRNVAASPSLQWDNLKRRRHGLRERDSSGLPCEAMRVQAASVSTATANSAAVALKGTPKPKDLVRKRGHPSSAEPAIAHTVLEDGCKRVKTSRGSDSKFFWPKFILHSSRKDNEDDFMAMKGGKLPQRPKRRPKAAEKALLYCTPGNWLSDMTASRYDVRERKCSKRNPRGLKAMASMDSVSD